MDDGQQVSRQGEGELPLPPEHLRQLVGGSAAFELVGRRMTAYFRDFAGLKPDERVLDVGCGSGRMAAPLTQYLSSKGSYEGFDIVPEAIEWCQRNIGSRYPNFRFQLADIANGRYNPAGATAAEDYRFPYRDQSFDFVALTSLFTHLLPAGLHRYLVEIGRVTRPGARVFATFFLLNQKSKARLEAGDTEIDFDHDFGTHRTRRMDVPEGTVAFDEGFVRGAYREHGLEILEPVRYGKWAARDEGPRIRGRTWPWQDIIVARRLSDTP
jgi:SAM-dependent methyltransferase